MRREYNPHACRINNPVYDTLFVYLNDYEDGWVNIQIQTNQVRYAAKEQVVNGRAWFDIRHFPSGHYTVWIDYGPYSITRRFWHDLRYWIQRLSNGNIMPNHSLNHRFMNEIRQRL